MRRIEVLLQVGIGLALAGGVPVRGTVHRMFVTSTSGMARFGDWPDAGTATGLYAADAICVVAASRAGLEDADNFVAWLSDDDDDAYCRVHGLSGEVATGCGLGGSPPENAGPWIRVNGGAFSADIPDLFSPPLFVYLPPRLDEAAFNVHGQAWTGSWPDGTDASGFNCSNWTDSSGVQDGLTGDTDYTGEQWTTDQIDFCSSDRHLYCFETGPGDPLPTFSGWGQIAFVTSVSGNGNLSTWSQSGGQSGLQAGDAICQNLAMAARLMRPGSFKAWLSTGAIDARDRFTPGAVPWIRVDHAHLDADIAGFTDGNLHTALNLTETREYLSGADAWTGTAVGGTASAQRCSGWTSDTPGLQGGFGEAEGADSGWTETSNKDCDLPSRLYCLQDLPAMLFADDFATGNTAVWSSAVP